VASPTTTAIDDDVGDDHAKTTIAMTMVTRSQRALSPAAAVAATAMANGLRVYYAYVLRVES
jgi:hypothetical protein